MKLQDIKSENIKVIVDGKDYQLSETPGNVFAFIKNEAADDIKVLYKKKSNLKKIGIATGTFTLVNLASAVATLMLKGNASYFMCGLACGAAALSFSGNLIYVSQHFKLEPQMKRMKVLANALCEETRRRNKLKETFPEFSNSWPDIVFDECEIIGI